MGMSNDDGLTLVVGENGSAKVYDSTWDVVIHCETEEERDNFIKKFNEFLMSNKEKVEEEENNDEE